jgi:CheY-like chemotaxis protein
MASILLVDDDAESREAVAQFFRKSGHSVRCAPNGNQALDALTDQTPQVIILDYKMPELNGISFLEIIRCYLRWQSLPVILLTGYPDGQHIRRAIQLGVRKTFLKGDYNLAELCAHVEACGGALPSEADAPHSGQPSGGLFN